MGVIFKNGTQSMAVYFENIWDRGDVGPMKQKLSSNCSSNGFLCILHIVYYTVYNDTFYRHFFYTSNFCTKYTQGFISPIVSPFLLQSF